LFPSFHNIKNGFFEQISRTTVLKEVLNDKYSKQNFQTNELDKLIV